MGQLLHGRLARATAEPAGARVRGILVELAWWVASPMGDQELWPFMLDVVNESSSVVEAADIRRTAFSNRSGCPYSSTALKGVQGSFSSRLV